MTPEHRNATPTGEGTLIGPGIESAPLADRISPADMEILLAFQQDVQAAQRAYSLLMAQFSGRYQLHEGDHINLDGSIVRRD